MNYYISDLHLFHDKCIEFDNRPFTNIEEMHKTIISNWNSRITNGDIVYILGDISLRGNKDELISLVSILKGRKVLVKGNHDDLSDYRYSQLLYEICDYKEVTDCCNGKNYNLILSHYPIFSWKKMGRGYILLYGHTHNSPEDIYYQKCLQEMNNNDCRHIMKSAPTAINVGCMKEYMDYTPRTFKEIYEKVINNE